MTSLSKPTATSELVEYRDAEIKQMALIEQAWKALAQASTFKEFKDIRDQSSAVNQLMRKRGMTLEAQNEAAKIYLAASLRMGEYLKNGMEKATGGQPYQATGNIMLPVEKPQTYAELGIKKMDASRLQRLYDWQRATDGVTKAVREITEREGEELVVSKVVGKAVSHFKREIRINKIIDISEGNVELDTGTTYPVIYADPPRRYDHQATDNRAIENQYPTMDIDEICALPVNELASPDAILFLWTTSPKVMEAGRVIEAWGFEYVTCAIWDKVHIGQGYYFRQQHELLLVAKRGDIPPPEPGARPAWSVWQEQRTEHSAKPVKFAEIIEATYPDLPKIELFCRSPREGWEVWGNQADAA